MRVIFKRTGARRYAVILSEPGRAVQRLEPAPGYDDDIPHDLVHYVVEAELRLADGVFGRAAKGGGTFVPTGDGTLGARELARERRKQRRREAGLGQRDAVRSQEMATSERLAAVCDVMWRRRHGQPPDRLRRAPEVLSAEDAPRVARVLARLDELAPLWRGLAQGGELVFEWPEAHPVLANGV